MAERVLPEGDDHQVIHLGGESAVIVPLDEYRNLRKEAIQTERRRDRGETIRMTAEEFVEASNLPDGVREELLAEIADRRAARGEAGS
ncbi:hypothetical protein [Actinomadura harenae]|nr:hypothetical protein [Actinomadura harenae]